MTFLKKLGQIIATGVELVTGFAPILTALHPSTTPVVTTVQNDLSAISQIVVQAEALGAALGLNGPDKLRAATGPVVQILMQSELIAGKPMSDTAAQALNTAAQQIINGVVTVLNAVHESAATTTALPKA